MTAHTARQESPVIHGHREDRSEAVSVAVTADLHFWVQAGATGEMIQVDMPAADNELVALLIRGLQERGSDGLEDIDVRAIADRVLSSVPQASEDQNPWNDLVGPFYTTPALNRWRAVTRQRHQKLRAEDQLLWVPSADGELLYPSFQFDDEGKLLPHLSEILAILREAIADQWTLALWLNTPLPGRGDSTAAELLRRSADDVDAVKRLAEDDVASRRR